MDETSHENEVNRIIGENIRIRRCLKGLSQDALGNAVGVSFQQIASWWKTCWPACRSTIARRMPNR